MRWRSVAIAGALLPASAGCNIAHYAAQTLINEPHVVLTEHAIEHDLKKSAKAAWEASRGSCAEHADSPEFRDGFLVGFVDYLDRGGNGSLRAVPPARYTRHKKYYTENGQCLLKEFLLGFKMGQEVAISSGRRQYLTIPVLMPQQPPGPPSLLVQPPPEEKPPMMIPPRPLGGVEASSGRVTSVPNTAVPRVATTPPQLQKPPPIHQPPLPQPVIRLAAKTAPTADFEPVAKPIPAAEPVVKSAAPGIPPDRATGAEPIAEPRGTAAARADTIRPQRPGCLGRLTRDTTHADERDAARSGNPGGPVDSARAAAQSHDPPAVAPEPPPTAQVRGAIR